MARRMSLTQYRSKLRQVQAKRKQAIDKYNRAVRDHNQKVRSAINKHNQAVNRYNSQVRSYNSRVRANRERLRRELSKLARAASQPRYVTFRASVDSVQRSYVDLEARAENSHYDDRYNEVLDLSEQEAANSVGVMNALLNDAESVEGNEGISSSNIDHILAEISNNLIGRWHGALFSLNAQNPDAARHFCTSARELVIEILDSKAPDDRVLMQLPGCETTDKHIPTRRSKVRYLLMRNRMSDEALEDFVEKDIDNVVQLFRVFNDGTHGSPGHFTFTQLVAIKKRVEDAIAFLWSIISNGSR